MPAESGTGLRRLSLRRGSVLVEGALATLPLLALLWGTFDVCFGIFVKNTMQFAVRQGVRYAVTSQTMAGLGHDASIKTTVKTYSLGLADALSPTHNGMNQISITYYDPVTLAPVAGAGSNGGGNIVVVAATGLTWAWMIPLLRTSTPLTFSVASADIMEASPLPVLLLVKNTAARRGSAMIEAALILSVAVPVLLGVTGIGVRLGRTLEGTQVTRDVAHMYAMGTDFSLPGTQAIARTLSRDFSLTGSGNAVLILSRVVKVFQADCDAAGVPTCPNRNQSVFTQRIVIGNSALRASSFGTPPATYIDAAGNISSSNYCKLSTLVASGFEAVLSLQSGQSAYLVEGYYSMPEVNLAHFGSPGGGFYVRLLQ